MKQQPLVASLALSVLSILSGCVDSAEPPTAPAAPEISRDAALSEARRDAQTRYNFAVSGATASRSGGVWVIDLRTADGAQAHYAIAGDGSIRERRFSP